MFNVLEIYHFRCLFQISYSAANIFLPLSSTTFKTKKICAFSELTMELNLAPMRLSLLGSPQNCFYPRVAWLQTKKFIGKKLISFGSFKAITRHAQLSIQYYNAISWASLKIQKYAQTIRLKLTYLLIIYCMYRVIKFILSFTKMFFRQQLFSS